MSALTVPFVIECHFKVLLKKIFYFSYTYLFYINLKISFYLKFWLSKRPQLPLFRVTEFILSSNYIAFDDTKILAAMLHMPYVSMDILCSLFRNSFVSRVSTVGEQCLVSSFHTS